MVAPLVGMLVANVASSALSGSGEKGDKKAENPIEAIMKMILGGGDKDKKESNPIASLMGMATGGGGGGLSLLG